MDGKMVDSPRPPILWQFWTQVLFFKLWSWLLDFLHVLYVNDRSLVGNIQSHNQKNKMALLGEIVNWNNLTISQGWGFKLWQTQRCNFKVISLVKFCVLLTDSTFLSGKMDCFFIMDWFTHLYYSNLHRNQEDRQKRFVGERESNISSLRQWFLQNLL